MTDKTRPPQNTFIPGLPGSKKIKTPNQSPVFNDDILESLDHDIISWGAGGAMVWALPNRITWN